MFILFANKNLLTVRKCEYITSGSVNVYRVRFEFSADWEGLTTKAVFIGSGATKTVLLDDNRECVIPWECLTSSGNPLIAGVFGKTDDAVLPTVRASLGTILSGIPTDGEGSQPPTPDLWQQELDKKQDTLHGLPGQVVGFDAAGNAVAQDNTGGGGTGPQGPPGPPGPKGDPGEGVPPGGRLGQVLMKSSSTDYDTKWSDPGGGVTYTAGDGIDIVDDVINVDNPNRGILTEAEFDALTEEQQASGTYFVDDGQDGGGNGLHIYSTEEKVVGKWVDGSDIYERTIVVENLPNSTTWQVVDPTLKSSDVRVLVNFYGGFIPNTANREFDPIFFISGTAQGIRVTGNIYYDGVRIINNYFNSSGTINANLTIQYVRV